MRGSSSAMESSKAVFPKERAGGGGGAAVAGVVDGRELERDGELEGGVPETGGRVRGRVQRGVENGTHYRRLVAGPAGAGQFAAVAGDEEVLHAGEGGGEAGAFVRGHPREGWGE